MDAYPQSIPPVFSQACGSGQNSRSYGFPLCRDTPFARMMYRHFGLGPNRDFLTAEPIIAAICQMAGLSQREVLSRSRKPNLVSVRGRIAIALRGQGMSYPAIGRALGRDHSTVMHAIRKATQQ